MSKIFLLILVSLTFNFQGAFAQEKYLYNDAYEAIPPTQAIRLAGKGVQGRTSGHNLALACVGKDQACDQFRFVYYVSSQEIYFVGHTFKLKSGDPADLKKAMKRYSKNIHKGDGRGLYMMFGGIALGFVGLVALPATLGASLFITTFFGSLIGLDAFPNDPGKAFDALSTKDNFDGLSITNTNGWNWISHPRRISEKSFYRMVFLLQVQDDQSPLFDVNRTPELSIIH